MSLDLNLVALGNALKRLAESLSYDASQPLVVLYGAGPKRITR